MGMHTPRNPGVLTCGMVTERLGYQPLLLCHNDERFHFAEERPKSELLSNLTQLSQDSLISVYWEHEVIFFTCLLGKSSGIEKFGLKWKRYGSMAEAGYLFCQRSDVDTTVEFRVQGSISPLSEVEKGCLKQEGDKYLVTFLINSSAISQVGGRTHFYCEALHELGYKITSSSTLAILRGEVFI